LFAQVLFIPHADFWAAGCPQLAAKCALTCETCVLMKL
jgi:hypothetical protein